jgi:hypothetical protein
VEIDRPSSGAIGTDYAEPRTRSASGGSERSAGVVLAAFWFFERLAKF